MIGLREDQQMKARIIGYLNNATAPCRRWLASDDGLTDTTRGDYEQLDQRPRRPAEPG